MFRSIASIVLIVSLLSGLMMQSMILVHFKVNQDAIASTSCVQKNEVENACQGSCHLSKQLNEAGDQQAEFPAVTSLKLVWTAVAAITCCHQHELASTDQSEYDFALVSGPSFDIFHPPSLFDPLRPQVNFKQTNSK